MICEGNGVEKVDLRSNSMLNDDGAGRAVIGTDDEPELDPELEECCRAVVEIDGLGDVGRDRCCTCACDCDCGGNEAYLCKPPVPVPVPIDVSDSRLTDCAREELFELV